MKELMVAGAEKVWSVVLCVFGALPWSHSAPALNTFTRKLRTQGATRVTLTISSGSRFRYPLGFLVFLLALPVSAQNVITFTAEVTSGVETVIPVLTWDTTPLADACVASGDWSGSKGPSGTETLPSVTSSATYNITCSWLDVKATLTWTAPTQNTDGTVLTDLAGFKLKYGMTQSGPYDHEVDILDPNETSHVISPLASGNWFFVSTAYNAIGTESDVSNEVMKNLGLLSGQESVGITVNPKPSPPTSLGIQ